MEMQEPSEEMALQHKKERKDLQGKKLKARFNGLYESRCIHAHSFKLKS